MDSDLHLFPREHASIKSKPSTGGLTEANNKSLSVMGFGISHCRSSRPRAKPPLASIQTHPIVLQFNTLRYTIRYVPDFPHTVTRALSSERKAGENI